MPRTTLNLEPLYLRIATLVVGAVVVMLLLVFAIRFFGDAISDSVDVPELAEFSKSMAPGNPKAYLTTSSFYERSFRNEDLKLALNDARIAVVSSPDDFAAWQTYGRLLERSGDIKGAETALRRALTLAPNFASVQWSLGNLLLRQDKTEEAFSIIKSAVEGDRKYAGPAASIAWDIFEGDMEKVKKSVGESGPVKTALAVYLSKQKRYTDALEIWKALSKEDRSVTYVTEGKSIMNNLVSGKKFVSAISVAADLLPAGQTVPKTGVVTNGGFETNMETERPEFFQWSILKGDEPTIGLSVEEKRTGSRSLAVFFPGSIRQKFRPVSQTIALNSGETYSLTVHYKASVESDATLVWQVADTAGAGILSSTGPILANSEWASVETNFTVPENSEGVIVRLARAECARLKCPIRGTVWFDDIEIK